MTSNIHRMRCFPALVVALCLAPVGARAAPDASALHGGRAIYEAACVACHGWDGAGAPKTTVGFEKPSTFPDFTKPEQSLPEFTRDWKAVIRDGGPARGFSAIMPAFGDVLTPEQIDEVAGYLRSLAQERDEARTWPPGELNVPRALLTEKAFAESEVVLTTSVDTRRGPDFSNTLAFEYRIDGRNQLEVSAPITSLHQETGGYATGLGDLAVGLKHVFFWNLDATGKRGSILAVQGEVILPTGNAAKGLGTGELTFGVFASYDVLLPASSFLQLQAGGAFPLHTETTPISVYARGALGTSFSHNFGRQWSPIVELAASRDLRDGAAIDWTLVPELQVTLSARQHVRAALGYQVALNDIEHRPNQVTLYLLWDWFDGGLLEGW
jgi:mono/diheme cytochrome c family protein